jgi:hypothetical protein
MINKPDNASHVGKGISGQAKPDVTPVIALDGTGRDGLSRNDDTTHPSRINTWPEGVRRVVCLNCDKIFESESKAHRLCRACR